MKKLDAHEQFVASIAWGRQTNAASAGGESQDDVAARPVNVMATCSSDKVLWGHFFTLSSAMADLGKQTVKIWVP